MKRKTAQISTQAIWESISKSALNDGEFATIKNHSAVDRDASVLSTHPTPF